MKQVLFASDLDNTLLFSYKYRQESDLCIEWLDGREQGFFTARSIPLLRQVREKALFVPVTSRSVEQYKRIRWPEGCEPRYALTTNGALLLVNGEVDEGWKKHSFALIEPWREELEKIQLLLPAIKEILRFRMIDDMYLFAACEDAENAHRASFVLQGKTELHISVSGRKLYFFPEQLHKGKAVDRLMNYFSPRKTISAGDSVIDIPMLCRTDISIVPVRDLVPEGGCRKLMIKDKESRFSDYVLTRVLTEV